MGELNFILEPSCNTFITMLQQLQKYCELVTDAGSASFSNKSTTNSQHFQHVHSS